MRNQNKEKEGSLNDSSISLNDFFTEGMKLPELLITLVNCMKNVEA